MVVRNGQAAFNEVVEGYLKHIKFGDLGYASAIELPQFTNTRRRQSPSRPLVCSSSRERC